MRKIRGVCFWFMSMLMTLGSPAFSSGAEVLDPGIEALGGKWAVYYEAGDLDSLMTLYVDDAMVALHGQPALRGKDAIQEYFRARIGRASAAFEIEYEVQEMHGEIAYIISKYWMVETDKASGKVTREAGRSLLVYKKAEDGQWKIAVDIDQSTPDVTWPSPSGMN